MSSIPLTATAAIPPRSSLWTATARTMPSASRSRPANPGGLATGLVAHSAEIAHPRMAARYALGPVLGRGATATVRAAEDLLLGRTVAVKLFSNPAIADHLAAQEDEIRLAGALHHPALTMLFDAGVDRSEPDRPMVYLVMEYVEGGDLVTLLREGPLSLADTCRIGANLAEAVAHIHAAGFLHRDIKPANVLIVARTPTTDLRGKLTDFGISSPIGRCDTPGWVDGTAAYLSPEQVQGDESSTASDVYSLGLVLLEATTNTLAFPGSAADAAFARLIRDPAIPAAVPPALATVLRRMTARDPRDRGDPALIAGDLRRIAAGCTLTEALQRRQRPPRATRAVGVRSGAMRVRVPKRGQGAVPGTVSASTATLCRE